MLNKLQKEVETLTEDNNEIKKEIENLQENIGVLEIYKEIIRANKRAHTISIITIVILSVLLVILTFSIFHNEKEFTRYREESITKEEIIDLLKENN